MVLVLPVRPTELTIDFRRTSVIGVVADLLPDFGDARHNEFDKMKLF
jgi:hypothetical protein